MGESRIKDINSYTTFDGGLYVVEFWAPWCSPCKALAPRLSHLADVYPTITFLSANIDDDRLGTDLGAQFGITSVPTVLLLSDFTDQTGQDAEVLATFRGSISLRTLKAFLDGELQDVS